MKKIIVVSLLVSLIITSVVFAGKPQPPPVVTVWPNGAKAAVTYTFDDWTPNQYPVAVPIFNSFNFKATFFICTGWISDWSGPRDAGAQGHEIASHTIDHTRLSRLSIQDQIYQYSTSKAAIEAEVGKPCTTIAYPNCAEGDIPTIAQYFIAGRICGAVVNPGTPPDLYQIYAIGCGTNGRAKTLANFISYDEEGVTKGGWVVYLLHGIDNDGGFSPLPSTVLRDSLQYLKDNQSKFWVATFADVANYIKQRDSVQIAQLASFDSSITLQVTSELTSDEFNFPITMTTTLPAGWKSANVSQKGHPVNVSKGPDGAQDSIMFSVVPNAGDVVLFKAD